MDDDALALPDDIDALKAALTIERARLQDMAAERDAGAAELAVARAKASADLAMIAHQKLRIASCKSAELRNQDTSADHAPPFPAGRTKARRS